jgi:predicted  nucleic acid-binding Zn-ribbon protein
MIGRSAIVLAIGVLLVGLLVGYVIWGRPPQRLASELADTRARLAEQTQRAGELQQRMEDIQRKFAEMEGELMRAGEGLRREREAREKLEEVLSKGRK